MSDVLAGKVALVTGAGRGLGRAFAERLAAMGCAVGIHGMRENGPAEYGEGTTLTDTASQIASTYGVKTIRVLGDLTQNTDVARVVAEVSAGPPEQGDHARTLWSGRDSTELPSQILRRRVS